MAKQIDSTLVRSNFIIISAKPSLDGIARGIARCGELLPPSGGSVNVSVGNVTPCGGYRFDIDGAYTDYSSVEDGIANQLSQFKRHLGETGVKTLNVFLLDNPYGDDDLDALVFETLMKVKSHDVHGFNVEVTRIVFAYDICEPANVKAITSNGALQRVLASLDRRECYTLMFGNMALADSALFASQEHHDFHVPRALFDFMVLISCSRTGAELSDARNKSADITQVFSIGHAEYAYLAADIHRLIDLCVEYAMLDLKINGESDSKSLSFEDAPIGLRCRVDDLAVRYKRTSITQEPPAESIYAEIKRHVDAVEPYVSDPSLVKALRDRIRKGDADEVERAYEMVVSDARQKVSEINKEVADSKAAKAEEVDRLELEHISRGIFRRLWESITGAGRRRQHLIDSAKKRLKELEEKIVTADLAMKAISPSGRLRAIFEEIAEYEALVAHLESTYAEFSKVNEAIERFRIEEFSNSFRLYKRDDIVAYFRNGRKYRERLANAAKGKNAKELASLASTMRGQEKRLYDHVPWNDEELRKEFPFLSFSPAKELMGEWYRKLMASSQPAIHCKGADMPVLHRFLFSPHDGYVSGKSGDDLLPSAIDDFSAMRSSVIDDKLCAIQIAPLTKSYIEKFVGLDVQECEVMDDGSYFQPADDASSSVVPCDVEYEAPATADASEEAEETKRLGTSDSPSNALPPAGGEYQAE